jgi:phospholipase/carboxylesterase
VSGSRESLHCVVRPAGPAGQSMLLMLHGYGSDEQDLLELAGQLGPGWAAASVRAPLALDSGGYAWYPLQVTQEGLTFDCRQAGQVAARLVALAGELKAAGAPDRLFALGFSQGGGMTLAAALRAPGLFAGAVSLCGVHPPELLDGVTLPGPREFPVFMSHGRWDPVVPVRHARETRQRLGGLPLALTYREYVAGHQIDAQCLADLREWLAGIV